MATAFFITFFIVFAMDAGRWGTLADAGGRWGTLGHAGRQADLSASAMDGACMNNI